MRKRAKHRAAEHRRKQSERQLKQPRGTRSSDELDVRAVLDVHKLVALDVRQIRERALEMPWAYETPPQPLENDPFPLWPETHIAPRVVLALHKGVVDKVTEGVAWRAVGVEAKAQPQPARLGEVEAGPAMEAGEPVIMIAWRTVPVVHQHSLSVEIPADKEQIAGATGLLVLEAYATRHHAAHRRHRKHRS